MRTIDRVIGIDPGKNAAMTYLIKEFGLWTIKYIGDYDERILNRLVCEGDTQNIVVALEKAQASPQMGVVSAFNYGLSYGLILNGVENCVKKYELVGSFVSPVTWKTQFGLLKKPKSASIKKVRQIFHYCDKELLKKITHHGADSALIGLSKVMFDK